MAEPDDFDDVQRLLRAARRQQRSTESDDLQWVWDAAAAPPDAPVSQDAVERMAADGRAMLEFGIASAVLAERGRRTAAGDASADRVLAAIRRQRFQRRRTLMMLTGLAAAALLLIWLWPAGDARWEPCEVTRVASRGGESVSLRLRLWSPRAWSPAVFLVESDPDGVRIDPVHPLAEPLRRSPSFRAWPEAVLPADTEVVLPPPSFDQLVLGPNGGWAIVVTGPEVADDTWITAVETELRAALAGGLDEASVQRACERLEQQGWKAQARRVTPP